MLHIRAKGRWTPKATRARKYLLISSQTAHSRNHDIDRAFTQATFIRARTSWAMTNAAYQLNEMNLLPTLRYFANLLMERSKSLYAKFVRGAGGATRTPRAGRDGDAVNNVERSRRLENV